MAAPLLLILVSLLLLVLLPFGATRGRVTGRMSCDGGGGWLQEVRCEVRVHTLRHTKHINICACLGYEEHLPGMYPICG